MILKYFFVCHAIGFPCSEVPFADTIFDPCRAAVRDGTPLEGGDPCRFVLGLAAVVQGSGELDVDAQEVAEYLRACAEGREAGPTMEGMADYVADALKVRIGEFNSSQF